MSFNELGLAAPVLAALEKAGYSTPTPIQAQAIPPVVAGSDLLGIAQTGTGKTGAFAMPTITRLIANRRPALRKGARVLVLSPTRELSSQIGESFKTYGREAGISVAVVFGGVGFGPQVKALSRGVDVLVATPGRLLDHVAERTVDLSGTEVFVLDEADQMLDLGFVKPIRRIVSELPSRRQNLFFSATMPKEIAGLADELLKSPVRVAVTPVATTAERVEQSVIHIEAGKKRSLLAELFADQSMQRTLVFTRTKRGADRVAEHLIACGVAAAAIHGNKSQRQREAALADFKAGRMRVLVATDIASRGIDIDAVSHVVNYELPEVPEAYVHRIGRTARAGASGRAISLCDGSETHLLRAIERLTRQAIPSSDRRNDASLAATSSRESGVRAPRSGDRPGRSRDGDGFGSRQRPPHRGARGDRDDRRGDRRDDRPGRDRSQDRGPDRSHDRSGDRFAERSAPARGPGHGEAARGRDEGRWSPLDRAETGTEKRRERRPEARTTPSRNADDRREDSRRGGERGAGPVRFGETGARVPAFMNRERGAGGGGERSGGERTGTDRKPERRGDQRRDGARPPGRTDSRPQGKRGPPRTRSSG